MTCGDDVDSGLCVIEYDELSCTLVLPNFKLPCG